MFGVQAVSHSVTYFQPPRDALRPASLWIDVRLDKTMTSALSDDAITPSRWASDTGI